MKLATTIFILLASFTSHSQTDSYPYRLSKIIADAQNDFKNLRGEIKKNPSYSDTIYYSKVKIEGSTQNEISRSSGDTVRFTYYFSCRLDSSSIKEAKKIVARFKHKTEKALGQTYKVETFYQNNGRWVGESKGFIFSGPDVIITITYNTIIQYPFAYSYLMIHKK